MKLTTPTPVLVLLLCLSVATLGLPPAADAAIVSAANKPKPPPPPPPPPPPSGTFVKAFGALAGSTQLDLATVDAQPTADGGYIALAETTLPGGGVNWLAKLSSTGSPQWQEELGCLNGAPGDYSDGVSVQQTADGAYIVGGGTVDCGSGTSCPALSGHDCALVEKLDSAGRLTWARVYAVGPAGSSIDQIRQTTDGGYIAAGSATDLQGNTSALLLKLDSAGNLQWRRALGPAGANGAYFNSVVQTSDGGYVATGDYYTPTPGVAQTQALVASFGADGNLNWQHEFATLDGNGAPTSKSDATSIIQTSDGGFAVAGTWSNGAVCPYCGTRGGLLFKVDASGNLQWQQAYTGGVYCYYNGYSDTCSDVGAVVYSLRETSDGGFVLAGDGVLELTDSSPIVPWLAKVDSGGNLLWQHFYYQTSAAGRSLSEDFTSSGPGPNGGYFAAGQTENYTVLKDEVLAVSTDSGGLIGSCTDVHPATALQDVNPALSQMDPGLPVQAIAATAADSPANTLATGISTQTDC